MINETNNMNSGDPANRACSHPSKRLFAHCSYNIVSGRNDWLWIACCDCGEVLRGSSNEYERYLSQHGISLQK